MSQPFNGNDNLQDDRSIQVVAQNAALLVLPVAAVSLRFYARKWCKARLWWDDYMCLVSLVFALSLSVNAWEIAFTFAGYGKREELAPEHGVKYLRELYIEHLSYNLGLASFKYAILLLYNRIFVYKAWLKITSWIIATLIAAWVITTELMLIFQCVPIDKFWHTTIPGHCLSTQTIDLAQTIPTIVFDISIIILVAPAMWNLQSSKATKIGIFAMFSIQGFVTIISIVRLVPILSTRFGNDPTWNYVTLGLWSDAEPAVGLTSACLPTFGVFFKAGYKGIERHVSSYTSSRRATRRQQSSNDGMMYTGGSEPSTASPNILRPITTTDSADGCCSATRTDIDRGDIVFQIRHRQDDIELDVHDVDQAPVAFLGDDDKLV